MKTILFSNQTEAVLNIFEELSEEQRNNARTTVVMPCGTGKTVVAAAAAEKMAPRTVVVFLPSLALLRQTLRRWKEEQPLGRSWVFQCVCSDNTIDLDEPTVTERDLGAKITTNAADVTRFLQGPTEHPKVIFSTYHSARVVARGMPRDFCFDLGLMDEAHRTAGEHEADFSFVLLDRNIRIAKRIFFTATPKHSIINSSKQSFSMGDQEVYGKVAYGLSFREAIDQGLISDYRIILSVVTSSEVNAEMVQKGIVVEGNTKSSVRHVAGAIAIRNAMEKFGLRKIFTFHRTVADAKAFVSDRFVRKEIPAGLYHVNGKTPMSERDRIIGEFADSEAGLVSNARCLAEGVDVPAVDMVAFMASRKSSIDIVQALGRALRRYPGKRFGYVLLPIYLEDAVGEDIAQAVKRADFQVALEVISTLKEQEIVISRGSHSGPHKSREASDFSMESLVEFAGHAVTVDRLRRSITVQLFEQKLSWDTRFAEVEAFHSAHGHFRLPRTSSFAPLISWVNNQRKARRRGHLAQDKAAALNRIEFPWTEVDAKWGEGLHQFSIHKEEVTLVSLPSSQLLNWCHEQRQSWMNGTLPADRLHKLNRVGFVFEPPASIQRDIPAAKRNMPRPLQNLRAAMEAEKREAIARVHWEMDFRRFLERARHRKPNDKINAWIRDQHQRYAAGILEPWKEYKLKSVAFRFDLPVESILWHGKESKPPKKGNVLPSVQHKHGNAPLGERAVAG